MKELLELKVPRYGAFAAGKILLVLRRSELTASEVKSSFEQDAGAYLQDLPRLFEKSEGKFVLIRSAEIVDLYDSYSDAMKAGYDRFAGQAFLVKEVSSKDRELERQLESCRS